MNKQDITVYLHNSKESNLSVWGEDLGQPDNDAGQTFKWCGYEIGFDCYVDLESGRVFARGIKSGAEIVKLEREVELT